MQLSLTIFPAVMMYVCRRRQFEQLAKFSVKNLNTASLSWNSRAHSTNC